MKQLIITVVLLCAAIGLQAQDVQEEIRDNIHKTAAHHYAYPGPVQARLTPAPEGKKPFYISHYGRHGSRYCTTKEQYTKPYDVLAKADSLGKLTALGRDVMRRVATLGEEANMRWGELTPLGAQQHRQIAKRMFERFSEVFEGDPYIDAKSTPVIRCILSMENALTQLLTMNPRLRIRHDASNHDVYYMKYDDKALKAHRMDSAVMVRYQEYLDEYDHSEALMKKLFNDMTYVGEQVDARQLADALFQLASNIQNTESRKKITLYDLFSDDEIYEMWKVRNMAWYIKYGRCMLNGGKQPYAQRNLLRKMIEENDSYKKQIAEAFREKRGQADAKGKHVVIVGGGDTGNDCIATVLRQGCRSVTALEMMPQPPSERTADNPWPEWPRVAKTDYGQEEAALIYGGDIRKYQTTVKEFISGKGNELKAVKLVELTPEKDEKTGRLKMTEKAGSEYELKADVVLICAGFLGSEDYITKAFGVALDGRTNVLTDSGSHKTSKENVFVCGDMHIGQSLVVRAIREGRDCAKEVDLSLMGYSNL